MKNRALALMILISITVLIRMPLFALINGESQRIFTDDAVGYDLLARNLLKLGVFTFSSAPPFQYDTIRTPVYPTLLAALYWIGLTPLDVIGVHVALSVLTALLLYRFVGQVFEQKTALIATMVWIIAPPPVAYTGLLLTETVFSLLFLASIYFLVRGVRSNCAWMLVLSGNLLAVATLTRPIATYLPILWAVLVFVAFRRSLKRALLNSVAFAAAFALVLSPWFIRNYVRTQVATVSTIQDINLLYYVGIPCEQHRTGRPPEELIAEAEADMADRMARDGAIAPSSAIQGRYMSQIAVEYTLRDPVGCLYVQLRADVKPFYPAVNKFSTLVGMGPERILSLVDIVRALFTTGPVATARALVALRGWWLIVDALVISVTGAVYVAALLGGIRLFRLSPWLAVFSWTTIATCSFR